ncbi:hypothetical protein EAG_10931 [Camponotus floridanus]|uniref:Uncharacterized protein n=1 Tax=Camponotus floridanus TaxID=104421 RepID=E2ALR5_CAMFO|nr:hypothetical protein EAG_10931 [Camponotus floridanus]
MARGSISAASSTTVFSYYVLCPYPFRPLSRGSILLVSVSVFSYLLQAYGCEKMETTTSRPLLFASHDHGKKRTWSNGKRTRDYAASALDRHPLPPVSLCIPSVFPRQASARARSEYQGQRHRDPRKPSSALGDGIITRYERSSARTGRDEVTVLMVS